MRALCLFLVILVLPAVASARSDSEFAYPYARVWTAAVRLLRIDLGCPIIEKDKEEGFFFFNYTTATGSRALPGSLEIIRSKVSGVEGAKVIVQIPAMPRYVEKMILKKLARKLKAEYGLPLSPLPTNEQVTQVLEHERPEFQNAEENKNGENERKED